MSLDRTIARVAVACVGVGVGMTACNDAPLAPRSVVVSPRVLAILADPPEAPPGAAVTVRVVTGGTTMEPTFRWFACARPEATTTFTATSTFGVAEPNTGCFPDADAGVIAIGEGPQITLPIPADLLQRVEALAAAYGQNLSAEALLRIARTSGLTLTLGVEMTHGAVTVRALKRVVVVQRAERNTNPPPPAFTLLFTGDAGTRRVRMARAVDDPEACAAFPLQQLRATFGQRVTIVPDTTEDAWLEAYDSYDSSGGTTRLREAAFYAWFTTAGWFTADRTRRPTSETTWVAPYTRQSVTLWNVVRDGRGGAVACHFAIEAAPP